MSNTPFTFGFCDDYIALDRFDNHIMRHLSSMKGQYQDEAAYAAQLAKADALIYEVYEVTRPDAVGELRSGLSIVHPGKIGDEYFMTKGHFHAVLETGEVYHCLKGEGMIVMETPEGEWAVERLHPGRVLYVPPRWAHRSVNTGAGDLVTFFVYPSHAGHDYLTIEKFGFRKIVIERDGRPYIADNPRWLPPEARS
ncbi:glucose-6-phosphate isomerase family protein [Caldilinea sp.]|jgi:glucose-6-phosphate isomerase|uniref:glucose-6-phosphate isomerase family protein n=1 Tax=Caldilinea sp. TaxID=2293560 RepID=UPI0021DEF661|nr:glucose-6-phosphate isomerase family protein [Caldilinea sp.]GIV70526.1 MAG: glucose-6-phosphate isomerase [Caldilinea sp.]